MEKDDTSTEGFEGKYEGERCNLKGSKTAVHEPLHIRCYYAGTFWVSNGVGMRTYLANILTVVKPTL